MPGHRGARFTPLKNDDQVLRRLVREPTARRSDLGRLYPTVRSAACVICLGVFNRVQLHGCLV